jgi:hypothetical protein
MVAVMVFFGGMVALAVVALVIQSRWQRGMTNEEPRRNAPASPATIPDRGMGPGMGPMS